MTAVPGVEINLDARDLETLNFAFAAFSKELPERLAGYHRELFRGTGTKNNNNVSIPLESWKVFSRQRPRRPKESGHRPDKRMTGTLGRKDFDRFMQIYSGKEFGSGTRRGIGWPDVQRADRATDYVWRSLEFGLGLQGTGESGEHKLPAKFGFFDESLDRSDTAKGFRRRYKKLRPKLESPGGLSSFNPASGKFNTGALQPLSNVLREDDDGEYRQGRGYTGKHFLEIGFKRALPKIKRGYEIVPSTAWRRTFG